ncbi:MAG: CrcB family protein [Armatimonadota bacterium]|nr:chromosome condensation protein CrcB [Armatimonadota bacterium]
MVQKLIWLSIAGACGTLGRYALCEWVKSSKHASLPLGTFIVNIAGCFLFGLIYVLAERKFNLSAETRSIILVGFMGAFTTFSALAFDTARLLKSAQWMLAAGNVAAQIVLGIAALGTGVFIARSV